MTQQQDEVEAVKARIREVMASPSYPTATDEQQAQWIANHLASSPERNTEKLKDLRNVEHRYVHRDDAVIITGAEYLRKSRLANQAEFADAPKDDTI